MTVETHPSFVRKIHPNHRADLEDDTHPHLGSTRTKVSVHRETVLERREKEPEYQQVCYIYFEQFQKIFIGCYVFLIMCSLSYNDGRIQFRLYPHKRENSAASTIAYDRPLSTHVRPAKERGVLRHRNVLANHDLLLEASGCAVVVVPSLSRRVPTAGIKGVSFRGKCS